MTDTYAFDFAPRYRRFLALVGVRPDTSRVTVGDGVLRADFGRWNLQTPLSNVKSAELTGPYRAFKAIGARMSISDGGLTFGTTTQGVCIEFVEPVRCFGPRPHGGLTVTVADREGLVARLS